MQYDDVLNEFWGPFSEALEKAEDGDADAARPGDGRDVPEVRQAAGAATSARRPAASSSAARASRRARCKYIKPGEGEAARPEPVETDIKCPTCGKPMVQRMGQRGEFLGCSGYPECKTTMNLDAEGKPVLTAQADRAHVREVRQADGAPRRPARAVPGLHRLPEVQERQGRGRRTATRSSRSTPGIKCEKCGAPMVGQEGPARPVPGLQRLPEVPQRQADHGRVEGEAEGRAAGRRRRRRTTARRSRSPRRARSAAAPMKLRHGPRAASSWAAASTRSARARGKYRRNCWKSSPPRGRYRDDASLRFAPVPGQRET